MKRYGKDKIRIDDANILITGQELTKEICKFNKSTPILFYSGAAYESDKHGARDAGAQGYLTKPEGISDLIEEVAKLIAEAKIVYPVRLICSAKPQVNRVIHRTRHEHF